MKQKIFPLALLSSVFVYAPLSLANDGRIIFPDEAGAIKISKASNEFGVNVYKKLAKDRSNEGKNIFFSNLSIHSILSAVREGASGPAIDEMQSVLKLPSRKSERTDGTRKLNRDLTNSDQVQLSVANALWKGDNSPGINPRFLQDMKFYSMHVQQLPFMQYPEASTNFINSWVEGKTQGKIKDLLPQGSIDSSTSFVLTNAIHFKGDWLKSFDIGQTRTQNFTLSTDKTVPVSMMNATFENVKYGYSGNTQLLELPYKGKEVSMVIMLPPKGEIAELEDNLEDVLNTELQKSKIRVSIPKFKLETNYELGGMLRPQMPSAFSGYGGFKNITYGDLTLDKVYHKAFVEVDEKGTEAAAATGLIANRSLGPTRFTANSPFIFAIKHNKYNTVLFMGKVENPTQ